MILTAQQIRVLFPVGTPIFTADLTYAVPTRAWLFSVFYPWFWQMRTALSLQAYARRNDCDNFARAVASAAQDCQALTPDAAPGAPSDADALAVGEFWYRRTAGDLHAICFAVVEAGLVFFEPQNGNELTLTREEIASCTFARA